MCAESHALGMQLTIRNLRILSPYTVNPWQPHGSNREDFYVTLKFWAMECPAIGAEIDVKTSRPKRGKRKRAPGKENRESAKKTKRCLNQREQRAISDAVLNTDKADLLSAVLQQVDDEQHIKAFPCRSEFWDNLKVSDMLSNICEYLKTMYQATYASCSKGKDKHMWFILQWYENCSKMLVEKPDGQSDTICQWIDYRNKCQPQCSNFHSNSVMIAV